MAEKRTIELEVKESGFQSLKSQLREAQAEVASLSDKFGATSKQAVEAAKAAAILKDKIGDAKALTDAFNPDAKFKAFSGALVGVAGGFSAVTGALGAFGKQNEEVEAVLLKVQSAMALASGLQAVGESIDSFKQLGAVLKANAIVQRALTAAQWLYNAAMAANPIGAIVVAITALIAAGYALIKMFSSSNEANAKNEAAVKKNTAALKEQVKANEKSSAALKTKNGHEYEMAKAAGASSEALRKLALKHADEQIALEKASLATAKNTYEKEKNTLANLKNAGATDEVIEKQKELTVEARKNATKEREDLQSAVDNKAAIIRANEVEIQQELTSSQNKKIDDEKAANEKSLENAKTANEKRLELEKEDNEKLKKATEDLNNELEKIAQDWEDKQKTAKQKRVDDAKKAEQDIYDNAIGYLEAAIIADENNIKAKKDLLDIERNLELQNAELTKGEIAAINAKYDKAQIDADKANAAALKEIKQKNVDFTLESATQALSIITDLAQQSQDKFKSLNTAVLNDQQTTDEQKQRLLDENNKRAKKAFEIQKAASIASTLINTYMSARSAYFSQFLPIPDPSSPIRGGIAAGLSVAGGLVAVKNIASQKFEGASMSGGGGGGGGSMGGGGAPTAPNFNIVGNSGINQLAELGGQPIQAYVVSGEVTSAQSLDRNRIQNATF